MVIAVKDGGVLVMWWSSAGGDRVAKAKQSRVLFSWLFLCSLFALFVVLFGGLWVWVLRSIGGKALQEK